MLVQENNAKISINIDSPSPFAAFYPAGTKLFCKFMQNNSIFSRNFQLYYLYLPHHYIINPLKYNPMTKILRLSFTLLLLMCGLSTWAKDVVIDMTQQGWASQTKPTSVTVEDVTVNFKKDKGANDPAYYTDPTYEPALRFYTGNSYVVSSTKKITKIIVATKYTGRKKNPSDLSTLSVDPEPGVLSEDKMTYTWTGSATEVTFTVGTVDGVKQSSIQTLTVTYDDGGAITVNPPTISGDKVFVNTGTITMAGIGDVAIHYTTDGTEPTASSATYTEPLKVNETTTVKAIAVLNGTASEVATFTATKSALVLTGEGTQAKPYTVGDALKIINAGADYCTAYTTDSVYIKGFVTAKGALSGSGSCDLTLSEKVGDEATLLSYKTYGYGKNVPMTQEQYDAIELNKEVTILTKNLKLYTPSSGGDSTPEAMYSSLVGTATHIGAVANADKDDAQLFNLQGQPVGKNYKGLVVKKGKKMILK